MQQAEMPLLFELRNAPKLECTKTDKIWFYLFNYTCSCETGGSWTSYFLDLAHLRAPIAAYSAASGWFRSECCAWWQAMYDSIARDAFSCIKSYREISSPWVQVLLVQAAIDFCC